MSDRQYCVYIMTNVHHTVLYTGVTNDLQRRVLEHREGKSGFTKKYNITKLVFFEYGDDINIAIAREKQIKGGSRQKKIDLINSINPEWKDLYEEYIDDRVIASDSEAIPQFQKIASLQDCCSCSVRNRREEHPPRDDTVNEGIASLQDASQSSGKAPSSQ
ncbi:MAG TPA: GIY-YIG nuclease family protein [Anaerolineales bacterium]|nr:GIY-YIG nuclease family protein [Anaerolineales bacterium]